MITSSLIPRSLSCRSHFYTRSLVMLTRLSTIMGHLPSVFKLLPPKMPDIRIFSWGKGFVLYDRHPTIQRPQSRWKGFSKYLFKLLMCFHIPISRSRAKISIEKGYDIIQAVMTFSGGSDQHSKIICVAAILRYWQIMKAVFSSKSSKNYRTSLGFSIKPLLLSISSKWQSFWDKLSIYIGV